MLEIPQEMKNDHPALFPIDLIERIISSTNASLVLDPFMRSGTTAIAAYNLGRNFIGIEISQEYIDYSERRLFEAKKYLNLPKYKHKIIQQESLLWL